METRKQTIKWLKGNIVKLEKTLKARGWDSRIHHELKKFEEALKNEKGNK